MILHNSFSSKMSKYILLVAFMVGSVSACKHSATSDSPMFKLLRKNSTGLDFENVLHQDSEFNVFNYMYFFNGGGVAAGDFNNDGLADLYFVSNMGPNKMFLNQGGLKFQDITEQAGVAGMNGWSTGVSVVDINNDGMLDLYVGQLGEYQSIRGRNQLFICKSIDNGVPVYADEAIYYKLDLTGFSTQAVFFDYDLDGDLDMFQLNHSLHQNGTFGARNLFVGKPHPLAGDKLFRNDSGAGKNGETVFTDVSTQAGIISLVIGYGLGISTGDVNNDGYPDIYIGNDFHENDYLYINQRDGTFREVSQEQIRHTSQFSMGVVIADVNNDGWNDIFSLDMMPEDPFILKSSLGEDSYDIFAYKIGLGYSTQFARNNLQINNGNGTFSELGLYAGIAASDWSWSPLFFDFDHDGNKDLFVSNGIPRRMNDIDYVNFQENRELKLKGQSNNVEDSELSIVEKMPRVKLLNKFYRNTGNLRFTDIVGQVDDDLPSFSNGAIYADLDNDGDLDVVTNNLEDEPFIYQNLLQDKAQETTKYLSVKLEGSALNRNAIGAKILVYKKNGERQVEENYPVRGFLSSAQIPLHFGIGDSANIDSILLIWPDRSYEQLADLQFNQTMTIKWQAGLPQFRYNQIQYKSTVPYAFFDETIKSGLGFQHVENPFIEFNRERLIPFMVSREGPALAVGDLNGDGLEDVFFGSSKRERAALYFQSPNGTFSLKTPSVIVADSTFEEVDAVFVDIENDGDLDIVIAAGGNEYRGQEKPMLQHSYINDGKGGFTRRDFEGVYMTAGCVLAGDFNNDGLVDLFFGARALPWNYGITPPSTLLLNKGNGNFEDVTDKIGGGLREAGLVKNGAWADMDGDGDLDLLLAIEWEPPTIYLNNNGSFKKQVLNDMTGWWNFMLPYDFDGDGDLDILAGNLGENNKFHPTKEQPVRMYVADFDDNQQMEQIVSYYVKGKEVPFANHAEVMKQLPSLKKKYLLAKDFAKATLPEIFGADKLAKAIRREANTFQSMYFENTGNGLNFTPHPLPDELQYSSLTSAALEDLDGDGIAEVILGGNFYESNIEMGRYDASYGNVLHFTERGKMYVYPLGDLRVTGQVRKIKSVKLGGETIFVLARNNEKAILIKPRRS